MRIPSHQVHNVLNAYARRLKEKHDAASGIIPDKAEDPVRSYSAEEKRRLIIDKIAADIIGRMSRPSPGPRIVDRDAAKPRNEKQAEEIRYHILTKTGDKTLSKIKLLDSDFLIRQLEEIARNSK